MYCRKCGVQIPDDSSFCPSCGTKVVAVGGGETLGEFDCPNCHRRTRWEVHGEGSQRVLVCSSCGFRREANEAEIKWISHSAGRSGSGDPGSGGGPPSPDIAAWLDKITTYVAGEGYVEKGRHGREDYPGGFSMATAEYEAGTATFQIILFADYRMAQSWVTDFSALPVVVAAKDRGAFRAMYSDRVAWAGYDNDGLDGATFAHWVKVAGRIKPPLPSAAEMQEAAWDEARVKEAAAQRGGAGGSRHWAGEWEEAGSDSSGASADGAAAGQSSAGEEAEKNAKLDALGLAMDAASTAGLLYCAKTLWDLITKPQVDHNLY